MKRRSSAPFHARSLSRMRLALAILTVIAVSFLFASRPAHAQLYQCSGPGPGQIVVGQTPAQNGIGPIPLCKRVEQGDGEAQSYQTAPTPLPDIYMAVITHPDISQVWAARGYDSFARAEKEALDACTRTMGEGCEIGAAWSNLSNIAVVEDAAGNLFVKGGATPRNSERTATKDCEQYSVGCHTNVIGYNTPITSVYSPPEPLQRRLFASVARPKGTPDPKWDDMAWLASGRSGFKAAEQAALSQCRTDTGMDCEIRVTVGNGQIARAIDGQGHIYWLNLAAPDALDKQLHAHCPKSRQCRLIDTFDARTPRTTIIEISKSDAPARGFFSLARPVDDVADSTWGKRALATGRASHAAAQAAAVELCEADSKSRCEAVPKNGDDDRGTDAFIVLLRTASGDQKISYGLSAADAQRNKNESCAKHNQKCPKGLTIDLGKPTTTLLKL